MLDASPPDRRSDPGTDRWELEDVYDPDTLALIEQAPLIRRGPSGTEGITASSAGGHAAPLEPDVDPDERDASGAPDADAAASSPDGRRRVRSGMAGLLMAGMMTGVADVIDPDRLQPEMVEFTPDQPDPATMPVQFVYVPGSPSASRLIIRPWLFGR